MSGVFKHGLVTGVMGPSGCGKTTLLNALCPGRLAGGTLSGDLLVNQQPKSVTEIQSMQSMVGFVPQADVLLEELTVEENLRYAARVKLSESEWQLSSRTWKQHSEDGAQEELCWRDEFLVTIMHSLEILHLRSEDVRNLSGGQKKRVSIALELAGNPRVLFLDEPTSGLDAASALHLMVLIRSLAASQQLTAVMVVHQPRQEIFKLLHNLLVLAKGRTIFYGRANLCEKYFEQSFGDTCEVGTTPVDWILDVVHDAAQQSFHNDKSLHLDQMHETWSKSEVNQDLIEALCKPEIKLATPKSAPYVHGVKQMAWHVWYNLLLLNRDTIGYFGRLLMGGAAALLLGVIYTDKGPNQNCGTHEIGYKVTEKTWAQLLTTCFEREFSNLILCNTLAALVVSLNASLFALNSISHEKDVMRRMIASGYSSVSYLLGVHVFY